MVEISIRELRNQGGAVVERVRAGEAALITRDGEPVAELRPLPRKTKNSKALLEAAKSLPPVDAGALRRELDELIDPSPFTTR